MSISLNKISLDKKGDHVKLDLSKQNNKISHVQVQLMWTKAVDLDLHAHYITKDGKIGHVYYGNKRTPYVTLDQDAGVGNTAGDNQENLKVINLDEIQYILFSTNIFRFLGFLNKGENFAKYDGKIKIITDLAEVTVPLNSEEKGKWAVIALIDNSQNEPKVVNINQIITKEPKIEDFN